MKNKANALSASLGKLRALWRDRKNQSSYWKWLLSYSKPYIPRIVLLIVINLATSLLSTGTALITRQVIDTASGAGTGFGWLIALYALCVFGSIAIGLVGSVISVIMTERFSFGVRRQLYEKIINSHWIDVQKYHTGDLMTRLTSDANTVADGILGVLPAIIKQILELIIVFVILFSFSPFIAVFALCLAPFAAIATLFMGRALKKIQVKVQESEAAYRSFLQESLANLLVIKSFSNEAYASQRLKELRDARFHWVFKHAKLSMATSTTMSVSFQAGHLVAFGYGALQLSRRAITYGTMAAFLQLVGRVQGSVFLLAQDVPRIVSVLASAGRIIELQDIPLEDKQNKQLRSEQVGVSISGLSFGYTPETVLEDVTADILPGEFVAIVGESGIGKTTLVRLLMSFMSHYEGNIHFYTDTGDQAHANAGTRDFLSYVPQGNTLFSGTIRENIRMGKLDASEEEMLQALRLAAGYAFVMELPQGLDTVIGERGYGLSEGQAQRIAIARAIVKRAPMLILDEATSALDENTELAVLEGLRQLQPRPTCLLITHRRSVLKFCDRELHIEGKHVTTSDNL